MDVTLVKIRKQALAGEVRIVHQGERIMVIDHFPAEVCTMCGDVLFTPEIVRRIEALRHTTASPTRTVPLYDFTDVKAA